MNRKFLIVAGSVLFVLFAWYLYSLMQWREQRIDIGWSPDARRHPLLAATQLLETWGVENVTVLTNSPNERQLAMVDALFVPESDFLPLPTQHQAVLDWVANGGHLLIGTGDEDFPPLLDLLGIRTEYAARALDQELADEENAEEEEELSLADQLRLQNERIANEGPFLEEGVLCAAPPEQCNELVDPELEKEKLVKLYFGDDPEAILVNSLASRAILHTSMGVEVELESSDIYSTEIFENTDVFYWDGDENGMRFAQAEYGQGLISILTDSSIFNNARIGHFDHAYLLKVLFGQSENVLLLEGKYMAPLSSLLWRYYRETLVGVLVLLIFGLWFLKMRFGAVRQLALSTRRSREEGMRAVGQWYWRRGESAALIEPLRGDVLSAASRRWPMFKRWSIDQQHKKIAQLCEMDESVVADTLEHKECNEEQRFVRLVRNLQKIRKCL